MDLDDAKTNTGRDRAPSVGDLVELYKFPEKKWTTVRLVVGLFSEASYWVKTKKKDGKPTKFNTPCPSYNMQSQERDSTVPDPWRDLEAQLLQSMSEEERKDRDAKVIQFAQNWYMQGIVRSLQKNLPAKPSKPTKNERKTGFKDKDSDSVTAKRVFRMGKSLLSKIQALKSLNIVEKDDEAKAYSVNHDKFGRDLRIYYDSSKSPAEQYQVQLGDKRTKLTDEEKEMLGWDLATATAQPEFDHDAIAADFKRWAEKMGIKIKKGKKLVEEDEDLDDDDGDDEDEDDEPKGKKSKKSSKDKKAKKSDKVKGKKSSKDDDDEEDEDLDDDEEDEDLDDDEDEDAEPKGKKSKKSDKKSKGKGKKSSKDDDDDDDDDDDFDDDGDDEDEDEDEPKKSKKSKKADKKAKGKKSSKDDDDDFDDEDDDSEEDDSEEDEDLDDDEEEDEPKGKKSKKADKKSKGKKSSKDEDDDFDDDDSDDSDDSDDDEDDDDDTDEDEDEEPKSKKSKGKSKSDKKSKGKKSKGKKSSKDDDDDDDFDD